MKLDFNFISIFVVVAIKMLPNWDWWLTPNNAASLYLILNTVISYIAMILIPGVYSRPNGSVG